MESIFDDTWGGAPWPPEILLVHVLLETGWSWEQWEATPPYIRAVTIDYLRARNSAQAAEHERQQSEARRASRGGY